MINLNCKQIIKSLKLVKKPIRNRGELLTHSFSIIYEAIFRFFFSFKGINSMKFTFLINFYNNFVFTIDWNFIQ